MMHFPDAKKIERRHKVRVDIDLRPPTAPKLSEPAPDDWQLLGAPAMRILRILKSQRAASTNKRRSDEDSRDCGNRGGT